MASLLHRVNQGFGELFVIQWFFLRYTADIQPGISIRLLSCSAGDICRVRVRHHLAFVTSAISRNAQAQSGSNRGQRIDLRLVLANQTLYGDAVSDAAVT